MPVNADFRDLFAALNGAGARYLLVGGYAVAFHAEPRFTKDLDVWVDVEGDNGDRVFRALGVFGAPLEGTTPQDFSRPEMVVQIGVPPNRIDVVTGIDGVSFAEAWPARVEAPFGDQTIHVIGRDHLIRNKRASGRDQDLVDLRLLEKHA
jgi:hypothetical protein